MDDKDRQIAELTRQLNNSIRQNASLEAGEFIAKRSPDKRIVAVMDNGLVERVAVFTESHTQELIAQALLRDRQRVADLLTESRLSWLPVETAVTDLHQSVSNIWWVAVTSDGKRRDQALGGLSQRLNSAYDAFTTAMEALPARYKDMPTALEAAHAVTEVVKNIKTGIRRILAGTDNGQYLESLGEPSLLKIARTIRGVVERRSADVGKDAVADACIKAKLEGTNYLDHALAMHRKLSGRDPMTLNDDELAQLEALKVIEAKRYNGGGALLRDWIRRRKNRLQLAIIEGVGDS